MQTHPCEHVITNDLKRTFTNDNEFGFSPIRQYVHDDVGSFSSMCEEALRKYQCELHVFKAKFRASKMHFSPKIPH